MNKFFYKLQTLFALTISLPLIIAKWLQGACVFKDSREFRNFSIKRKPDRGFCFEFGVYSGNTINQFADQIKNQKQNSIVGFDSWMGFSEEWTGMKIDYPIDHFARSKLPSVAENVTLIDGWIEDSFPQYLSEHKTKLEINKISFIHIDTDTYAPAKTILKEARPYFQVGTVIVFDELIGYNGFWRHEWRALKEELIDFEYEWICIGFVIPLIKVAIQIKSLPPGDS
jgi:hypothetical protein